MKRIITCVAASVVALLGAAAQAEIIIAVAGPMTGQYAAFGEQLRRGAEMAVADLNAKGGVLGQKLKLEVGDDACDPKQAVAVAVIDIGMRGVERGSAPGGGRHRLDGFNHVADIADVALATPDVTHTEFAIDADPAVSLL